jgi:toxin ParE1/3/4
MGKFHFTNRAVEDLEAIWNYTADAWSERQADLYYEMLINFCQAIADNPSFGKNYDGIAKNLYGFRANKHVIFYRIISQTEVEIVRTLHGRMDLKSRIRM